MPDRLDFIWSDLFGQSATMAQLVVLLFVASLILLLLSLVSFQLSRIRKPETGRENSINGNPSASKVSAGSALQDQPVLRVSWGQIEEKGQSSVDATARQVKSDLRLDKAQSRMAAVSLTGGNPASSGVSTEDKPLNVTYLNRTSRDSAGVMPGEQAAEGSRIGPLYFNQPKTDLGEEHLAAEVAEESEESIDGFIIKQRSRREPVTTSPAHVVDPEETTQFAYSSTLTDALSSSTDRPGDITLIELGKIEARMEQLKQFHQDGHISSDVYAEQSQQLFEQARQLMSKS